jgi:hypothetical protein
MPTQKQSPFTGLIALGIIIALVVFRRRIGRLRAAAFLVTLGTVGLWEHPGFSIINAFQIPFAADQGLLITPHARLHFFMAGIYSLMALVLILFIAWGGLLHGRRTAWYAILTVFVVGGAAELLAGAFIFQHGSPIYTLFGIPIQGFGWGFLYLYLIAWPCALAVSFRPIFGKSKTEPD